MSSTHSLFWHWFWVALMESLYLYGDPANEICGTRGTSQAIGFMLGFCSIPLTLGPTFSGYLYDLKKDYTIAFVISGVLPILGGLLMTLIHFFNQKSTTDPEAATNAIKSEKGGQHNKAFESNDEYI